MHVTLHVRPSYLRSSTQCNARHQCVLAMHKHFMTGSLCDMVDDNELQRHPHNIMQSQQDKSWMSCSKIKYSSHWYKVTGYWCHVLTSAVYNIDAASTKQHREQVQFTASLQERDVSSCLLQYAHEPSDWLSLRSGTAQTKAKCQTRAASCNRLDAVDMITKSGLQTDLVSYETSIDV